MLINTPENLDAIAGYDLGCRVSVEHPGYVQFVALNGRIAHVGALNGEWEFDVYERNDLGVPVGSFLVPASHNESAEGIARYVVGTIAGIAEYRAYASERERVAADRAERKARNRA